MTDRPFADLPEKALAVRQPWASSIIKLGKPVENRKWSTAYRGPVCIHACMGFSSDDLDAFHKTVHGRIDLTGKPVLYFPEEPMGGIIGVVDIVDCVTEHESKWFFGPYGFVLANPRPVEFIPVRGQLGFFDWRKRMFGRGNIDQVRP